MPYNFSAIEEVLESELPKKRFKHIIGVSHSAACLSMRYGESIEKARVAGLLHDCAKCLPEEEILANCKVCKLPISKTEESNPYLLHGKLGAYFAKTRFLITDSDILNAIIYHTTGRPEMTRLEKIIFIADYIEPERREIPGLYEIRSLVFHDLDKAVYLTLNNTLQYLNKSKNKENEIDIMTINAYNYYKNQIEERNNSI